MGVWFKVNKIDKFRAEAGAIIDAIPGHPDRKPKLGRREVNTVLIYAHMTIEQAEAWREGHGEGLPWQAFKVADIQKLTYAKNEFQAETVQVASRRDDLRTKMTTIADLERSG